MPSAVTGHDFRAGQLPLSNAYLPVTSRPNFMRQKVRRFILKGGFYAGRTDRVEEAGEIASR